MIPGELRLPRNVAQRSPSNMQASDTATTVLTSACTAPKATRNARSGAGRIVAFFALIAVLAYALDAFIGFSLRRLPTGDFGEWNRIVQGQVNAEVVVSGSSRALTHYDPQILARATGRTAYNIGLNGSQTDMQLARLKTYLRHNRKPLLVVQNLDAFSFQVTHGEVYDPGQYVPYLNEPDLYEALKAINPETWKTRCIPLYGYAVQDLRFGWLQGLGYWLRPEKPPTHFDGFMPRYSQWTGEFDAFRAGNPNGVRIGVEPAGVALVEELLRLCTAQGIKVVMVYSPEYSEVQAMTNNRAEIFAQFEALSRKYGATLLDFSDSPISARKDLFYNSQHLTAEGAEAFTRELALKLPLVATAASAGGPPR